MYGTGCDAVLVDSHISRCQSAGYTGGLYNLGGHATMIRSAITGCSASEEGGGACVLGGGTLSLVDSFVIDCRTTASETSDGGGIRVNDGTLIMNGGAFRNCEAPNGNGGGLALVNDDSQAQLSGVTVQGCKAIEGGGVFTSAGGLSLVDLIIKSCAASQVGGGIFMNGGDLSLVDVFVEDCVSNMDGGGVYILAGSTIHAERVHVARCHASAQGGGLLLLGGASTWIDCTVSECTNMKGIVWVFAGDHMFTRVAIVRCRALGGASVGTAGGLQVTAGSATMVDSSIADAGAEDGGCVYANGGALILRNTTLRNCSAPKGPYMSLTAGAASIFASEMLTLEPACDAEHSSALITIDGALTTPLDMRGLKVHSCGSSNLTILSDALRLSRCSDGGVCGTAATCTDVLPLPSAPNLTTVECSCRGEFFPNPAGTSLALAPYGFDPSIDYCVRRFRLKSAQSSAAHTFGARCGAGHAAHSGTRRAWRLLH